MKHSILAAALLLAATNPSFAQSPADHEKHHPDQQEAPATKLPVPSKGQTGMGGSSGMEGMMGGRGMMSKTGGRMPMMDMMQMLGTMWQSDDGMGGMATDHVEGRVAFLRTELKITDEQNSAWSAFVDVLRANAKSFGEVRASMMAGPAQQSLVDRLALQEKWLVARLEATRAIKPALTNLGSILSDDQKKTADQLLAPHIGLSAGPAVIRSQRSDER